MGVGLGTPHPNRLWRSGQTERSHQPEPQQVNNHQGCRQAPDKPQCLPSQVSQQLSVAEFHFLQGESHLVTKQSRRQQGQSQR
jgi:hypothetical protein